jgi:hypothetical protein
MSGDERKKRIEELRAIKAGDFKLRDRLSFSQVDMETWGDVMAELQPDTDKPNLSRLRRIALTAAHRGGWFEAMPELGDDDFVLLPPHVVAAVGDQVLLLFNDITNPDPSFT